MKQKKILIFFLISLFFLISSCNEFKRTLTNTKKPAGDEFLVEKKEPLSLPPNFNKLPIPLSEEKKNENEKEDITTEYDIKDLLKKNSKDTDQSYEKLSEDLEISILEKINNAD
tara:strand:+ start:726 stop:1067 length:342 start_codon:yes stop_codon:yes gene_type:complete